MTPSGRGIPTLRGQDHIGITVPDLEAAVRFFVDVVGCELATRFGPFRDDTGSFMADTPVQCSMLCGTYKTDGFGRLARRKPQSCPKAWRGFATTPGGRRHGFMSHTASNTALGVHPRAVVEQIALLRCGNGSNIELFQYSAPDQRDAIPKNSDIGGHHLAFYVDDIEAAVAYLKSRGVRIFAGPLPVTDGPAAGQTVNYFLAPWGLQLELISYPRGMAYEAAGGPVLWSPRN